MASTTTQWILELVDKITGPMRTATESAQRMTETVDNTTEAVENLGKEAQEQTSRLEKFGKGMFFLNEIKEGVDNITDSFMDAIQPGVDFEYAMAQVQAISGITKDQLQLVSDKGRILAKTFGADASGGARVFSTILSKLGPELAKYPDALDSIASNAFTLSKTMDGDVSGAAKALTTSFNAFYDSAMDAESISLLIKEQMNIIAKSAQVGAAEVTDLVASLENVGPGAKNAGVSFAETAASLQVLAQRGVYASEAGNALRNMFVILAKPTPGAIKELMAAGVNIDKLSDKTISFADRMKALAPVIGNDNALIELFGRENIRAGQIFLENVGRIQEWTEEVQNSNSATEQAAIIMDTTSEKMKRMQSWIDDLKISFFEFVEPFAPIIKVIGIAVSALTTLGMVAFSINNIMQLGIIKTAATWVSSAKIMTLAIAGIPIIGWIAGITAILAVLYNKSETFREYFIGFVTVIKTLVFEVVRIVIEAVKAIIETLNPLNWFDDNFSFKEVWSNFAKEAYDGGKKIWNSWEAGKAAGRSSWEKSHGIKKTGLQAINNPTEINPINNNQGSGSYSSDSGAKGLGLGGSGGGGGVRNITMNVTMNNTFTVNGETDYKKISQRFKQELIAIMTDASPAIS